jgi:putative membrane protein
VIIILKKWKVPGVNNKGMPANTMRKSCLLDHLNIKYRYNKSEVMEMMWGGTMIFSWIFWIVGIAALVWLISYLVNPRHRATGSRSGKHMEILKERFARGEISREEYEERRKTLQEV